MRFANDDIAFRVDCRVITILVRDRAGRRDQQRSTSNNGLRVAISGGSVLRNYRRGGEWRERTDLTCELTTSAPATASTVPLVVDKLVTTETVMLTGQIHAAIASVVRRAAIPANENASM